MSIDVNEAIVAMKTAGADKVRSVPMPGQNVNIGQYQIEIKEGTTWCVVVKGIPKVTAEQLISQATNRVILG